MKNNKIYKTIGEVAKEINTNTHTLRFWEKEFKQIKPKILSGKRRYYSEKEIDLLKIIYELLKNQGYTISGAKKLLNKAPLKLDDELSSGIKKKNFRGSIKLDPTTASLKTSQFLSEVMSLLQALPDSKIEMTLEINVKNENGIDQQTARIILENSITLKVDNPEIF